MQAEFNCALVFTPEICRATPNCAWATACYEAAHNCSRYNHEELCTVHGCAWTNTMCIPKESVDPGGPELLWLWYLTLAFIVALVARNLWQLTRSASTTSTDPAEQQSLL